MYSIESELRGILKGHGFMIASEMFDFRGVSKKATRGMIESWKNYPSCMNSFPTILSKKVYDETTHEYTKA